MSIKLNEIYFAYLAGGLCEVTVLNGPDNHGCYCCVRSNGSFCIVSGDNLSSVNQVEIKKLSSVIYHSNSVQITWGESDELAERLVIEHNYRKCEPVTKNELYEVLDEKIDPQTPWVDAVAILHDLGYAKLKKLD